MLQSSGYLNSFIIFKTLKACSNCSKRCLRICCALAACVFPVWNPSGWHVVPRAYLCAFDATSVPNVARHVFFIIAQCVIISSLKAMALLGICLLVTCRRPVHPATMSSLFWPVNRSSLQVKWQQLCFQRGKAVGSCCLSVLDMFNCLCSLESQCVYRQFIFIQNLFVKPETTAWICNSCFLPEGGVWALSEHIFSCFLQAASLIVMCQRISLQYVLIIAMISLFKARYCNWISL